MKDKNESDNTSEKLEVRQEAKGCDKNGTTTTAQIMVFVSCFLFKFRVG